MKAKVEFLIFERFGTTDETKVAKTIEELDVFKLNTQHYIIAANSLRDGASFVMMFKSPKVLYPKTYTATFDLINGKPQVVFLEEVK